MEGSDIPELVYPVNHVMWQRRSLPVIRQTENGPCPLLAIANILLISQKLSIRRDRDFILNSELLKKVYNCICRQKPSERTRKSPELLAAHKHMINEAVSLLPQLSVGLDVNVRFSNITDFEFTRAMAIFDVLNIRLVHGWQVDPHNIETNKAIKNLSYNQCVEKIIAMQSIITDIGYIDEEEEGKHTSLLNELSEEKKEIVETSIKIEAFLNENASQLTYYGLVKLHEDLHEGELAVFFRNNHFSPLLKHKGELYLLVTDAGYMKEPFMFEKLNQVDGDSVFVTPSFRIYNPKKESNRSDAMAAKKLQNRADYEMAVELHNRQIRERSKGSTNTQHKKSRSKNYRELPPPDRHPPDDSDCVLY